MPDSSAVLNAVRDDLVAAGLVRRPATAGDVPPVFVEPEDGAPAPGERDGTEDHPTIMVTLTASELAEGPLDRYRRRVVVTLTLRSRTTRGLIAARALYAAARWRLVDRWPVGGGVVLAQGKDGELHALDAVVYGGLGPVADDDGVRTERASFMLEVLAQ